MNLKIKNFLVQLKNVSLKKKENFVTNYFVSYRSFLRILYVEGYIQSFKILNKKLFIFIRNYYNRSLFLNLRILYHKNKQYKLNLYKLNFIQSKNLNIFLSTNAGLLTHYDCKKLKLGGKVFFIC